MRDYQTPYAALLDADPLLSRVRYRLRRTLGPVRGEERLSPISQLVSAHLDEAVDLEDGSDDGRVWSVYAELRRRFATWERLASVEPETLRPLIDRAPAVERGVQRLVEALRRIIAWRGELSLDCLEPMGAEAALRVLQNRAGVSVCVAANVLNFSSLNKSVVVVDACVSRVGRRIGLVSHRGEAGAYSELSEQLNPAWDGDDLYELHGLLKELGRAYCHAGAPKCHRCPLADLCVSARTLN
jgi:endonuclease-3